MNFRTVSSPTTEEVGLHVLAEIVRVNDDVVALAPFASCAFTVMERDCGAAVGVPEIVPVEELMLSPSGKVPDAME